MWLEDLVAHLEAAGVGTAGEDLFWGGKQDKPASCGAVIPYAGLPPELQFGTEDVWLNKPSIQFSWRSEKPDDMKEALDKAELAYGAIANVQLRQIGGTYFHSIAAIQSPFLIETDDGSLPSFGFNCRVVYER